MPDTDIETERQVRRLEEQFKRLSISDSEGDLESGFAITRFPTEAIGACCLGSDCQLLSARDCGNVGGIYQGDQTPCYPNPCEVTPCPTATLVCDSISASKTKTTCGFQGFLTSKIYRTSVFHVESHFTTPHTLSGCTCFDDDSYSTTKNYDDNCILTVSCSGGGSHGDDCAGGHSYDYSLVSDGMGGCMQSPPFSPPGAGCPPCGDTTDDLAPTTDTYSENGHTCCNDGSGCDIESTTLSNEYTTALLISNTISALPAYDGVFDDICGATLDVSIDETTCTIQRNQYKFLFSSPAPIGMIVSWDESGPDGVVHHTWTAAGGETETPVFTQNEPSTNGTTNTINIVVTCP